MNAVSAPAAAQPNATRIFVPETLSVGAHVKLPPSAAGHVSRVLRLSVGNSLILFDGHGGEYAATLVHVRGAEVRAHVEAHRPVERESPLRITLVQGVARGDRMDWVVQKATELGVNVIVPVLTMRTVVKLDARQAAKKLDHWRGIAIAACEQCGRNRLPDIQSPVNLHSWLESTFTPDDETRPAQLRLLLDPLADATAANLISCDSAILLIGPEGGLTEEERALAVRHGFSSLRMGPRVLRTETAGMAAISVLQGRFGDF